LRRKSATAAPAASDAADDGGMRPVVRLPRSGPSGVILALCALAAAIVLFTVLEMRRTARVEPAVRPPLPPITPLSTCEVTPGM